MPIFVDKIPQNSVPVKKVTIHDLLKLLDENLPSYVGEVNVSIGGKIAQHGISFGTITFHVERDGETTTEQKQYFASIVKPLGVPATADSQWKNPKEPVLRLYNKGRLIWNRDGTLKEIPSAVELSPTLTLQEFLSKLPAEVPWAYQIWLTGGLAKNGETCNDVDLLVGNTYDEKTKSFDLLEDRNIYVEIRKFFASLLGWTVQPRASIWWPVDVGMRIMLDREPVLLFKLYENGKLCLPRP